MDPKPLKILGVPIDLGGNHRGVDMGPNALRVARLNSGLRGLGRTVSDLGNVTVPIPESRDPGNPKTRFLDEIASVCEEVAATVQRELSDGAGLVVLGGDHSAAVGSVSGSSAWAAESEGRIGLIWVDAHTDMNTPDTSPSGNVHGMPVACLLGEGPEALTGILGAPPKVRPENVVFIGIRSVDVTERDLVRESGAHVFTMREVDEMGIRRVMQKAMDLACNGTVGFHLSFDMDGVDCRVAPGVGTPVMGGLTYRESHLICEMAHDSWSMVAMDLMEVNPVQDVRNATAELGVELILSAHGKKIL